MKSQASAKPQYSLSQLDINKAFVSACSFNNQNVAEWLADNFDVDITYDRYCALRYVCENENNEMLTWLIGRFFSKS